jgi:asparagine synthase (glutamine-hydrolysing)
MCGICGFLGPGHEPADLDIARRMTATLRHRGPDDEGYYVNGPVALGQRRLSIIDLETGHQPVSNEDGTVWAMLNGEIYNHVELREGLIRRGHRFTTRSDTEVLVHAWEDFGEDCIGYLNGMFALALWDGRRQVLLLARDRMGEKPLYYTQLGGWLIFGSELRAILAHPCVSRELDLLGLSRYLSSGYVVDPHTIVRRVSKLPPGHLLTVSGGKTCLTRYWDMSFSPAERCDESEWSMRVWNALCASVRRRLVADVPVGVFLSGGLDSSAVVAAAASVAPSQKLATFSVGFTESTYDETSFARDVAQRFGTDHHELVFTAAEARALLPTVGDRLDEPLADPAFLPTLELARQTRKTATVVLSGDGGDELFCGYPTALAVSRAARWLDLLPEGVLAALVKALRLMPTSTRYASLQSLVRLLFRAAPYAPDVRIQLFMGGFSPPEQQSLLSTHMRVACASFDPYRDVADVMIDAPSDDDLERLIYHHAKLYLAGQTLVKMDRATMAFGLEVRAAYLDHELVELACSIPTALKLKGWTTKYLLKRMMAERLPASIVYRRKHGFGVPLAPWLRGPLRPLLDEILHPDRLKRTGLFAPRTVARLVDEHVAGRENHARALWTLMSFELWREAYLPGCTWA